MLTEQNVSEAKLFSSKWKPKMRKQKKHQNRIELASAALTVRNTYTQRHPHKTCSDDAPHEGVARRELLHSRQSGLANEPLLPYPPTATPTAARQKAPKDSPKRKLHSAKYMASAHHLPSDRMFTSPKKHVARICPRTSPPPVLNLAVFLPELVGQGRRKKAPR